MAQSKQLAIPYPKVRDRVPISSTNVRHQDFRTALLHMSRIRSKDTSPEMLVRRFLHGEGCRYRVNVRKLPGSPDIVLAAITR